jgi:heavy metal sensor kinase
MLQLAHANSLRLRLTAWYVALFSVLFLCFGIFLYNVLARALQSRLDEALASQAATAASLFPDELMEEKGDAPGAATEVVNEMRGAGVAIFENRRSVAERALELPGGVDPASCGQPVTLPVGHGGTRMVCTRVDAGGRVFAIAAAEPLEGIAAELAVVRRVLFFAAPLLILLAALGGYALATRNLAPLRAMAEQARGIGGRNLEKRLEIGDAAEELAALAASFNELLARLDQSFESMRRFVADASHELRTPISVIRGEADVALSQERPAEEYRESLAIVLDESRRLSRLVDDLLNLARADAGRVQLQVREFYFNDLLAECCRSVQALAGARRIRLECRNAGEDVPFRGDEELLRRLVVNLLDNAIRYTPEGGAVTASLEARGREVVVRVADTGVGIAPEAAPHLFERFYRADKARSREAGGFGLGLAIVQWIAESHRGAVALSSRPGAGSTFTVTLPR